jgi:hypothetical protein
MYSTDFDAFRETMNRVGEAFNHEVPDTLVQTYWKALKDVSISSFVALAESHIKHGKFFPKPRELRPRDDHQPVDTQWSEVKAEYDKRSALRLEALRKLDPEEWLRQIRPKVQELGAAKGMLPGEIEAKIQRYLTEGPRADTEVRIHRAQA